MTNPLQGSDEETQERIAQVRARLDATKGDPSKPWWLWDKSRAREELTANAPIDLAFLLSRVDSLESALREAQKDAERVTWLEDQTWDDLGKLATLMDDERDCDTLRKAIDVARKRWADTGEST